MEDYLWFKSYDKAVPHSLSPYSEITVLDILRDSFKQHPDYPMLVFNDRNISYAEIEQHSNALAAALIANGVKKGDRVVTLFLNCPQSFIAFFAIWKVGGVVVPLNPLYTPFELQRSINEVDAKLIIAVSLWYKMVKSFQDKTGLKKVIATDLNSYAGAELADESKIIEVEADDLRWSDLVKQNSEATRPAVKVDTKDKALILFSGGTTGVPKGVVGTHGSITITAMQARAWNEDLSEDWKDSMILPLPLFHAFGIYSTFGQALLTHLKIVLIQNPRDIKLLIDTIKKYKISTMGASPALLNAILNYPERKPDDLRTLNNVGSGSAPLSKETKLAFEKLIKGRLTEGYGLTEGTMASISTPVHGVWKQGSVGLPWPDTIVKIVDMETGKKEMKTGEPGEILIKAPQIQLEYWKRPKETAEVFRDGWLYTGDIGYIDEDGYVFLTSRKKDVIKCGGFQVWPGEVEETLSMHPAVAEVGVAGIPDPKQVEAVKAWIVLKEGKTATEEELQSFCRERLTGYKVPRFYEFRKDLPKNFMGKILRRVLQEEEQNKKK